MSDCATCENEPVSSGECPECGSVYHNDVAAPVPTFICVPNDWADETAGRIVRQSAGDSAEQLRDRIAQALRAERERVTYLQGRADRAEKAEAQVARVRALVDDPHYGPAATLSFAEVRHALDPDPGAESRPLVEDGHGNAWERCRREDCDLHVRRPGSAQCNHPDCEEYP